MRLFFNIVALYQETCYHLVGVNGDSLGFQRAHTPPGRFDSE